MWTRNTGQQHEIEMFIPKDEVLLPVTPGVNRWAFNVTVHTTKGDTNINLGDAIEASDRYWNKAYDADGVPVVPELMYRSTGAEEIATVLARLDSCDCEC